jgi:hypothetical protein
MALAGVLIVWSSVVVGIGYSCVTLNAWSNTVKRGLGKIMGLDRTA